VSTAVSDPRLSVFNIVIRVVLVVTVCYIGVVVVLLWFVSMKQEQCSGHIVALYLQQYTVAAVLTVIGCCSCGLGACFLGLGYVTLVERVQYDGLC